MKIIIAITYYRIILKKHESLYHLLSDILLFTIMRKEIIFFLQRAYFLDFENRILKCTRENDNDKRIGQKSYGNRRWNGKNSYYYVQSLPSNRNTLCCALIFPFHQSHYFQLFLDVLSNLFQPKEERSPYNLSTYSLTSEVSTSSFPF